MKWKLILNNSDFFKKLLIVYHLIFPFICWYYTVKNPNESDSERYIRLATDLEWTALFDFGDRFVALLIYPFVRLGFGYLTLTLIFSLISLKGFLIYFNLYKSKGYFKNFNKNHILALWLFLPSLHFWTGFLSKDVVVFVMMALVLKTIESKNFKSPILYLFILLSFFIRPYSVIILSLGAFITFLFFSDYALKKKLSYFIALIIFFILTIPIIIEHFLQIKEFDGIIDLVTRFYTKIQESQSTRGSHFFDIFETPYYVKLLVLLIRPLYFDANSTLRIFASIQNTIVIIAFIYYLYLFFKKRKRINKLSYKFAIITAIMFWLIIGTYIFNLGQASRMRVMILPYLFYGLSGMYQKTNETKIKT